MLDRVWADRLELLFAIEQERAVAVADVKLRPASETHNISTIL